MNTIVAIGADFIEAVQFNSVTQSCPTLCSPMDCSMPGFPVHHQLPELVQTHIHRVSDAIQLSHPLWSPSPPAFNHSQYQSFPVSQFFTAGGPKYWSFSFSSSPSNEYSGLNGLISLSPRDSQESSPAPQFEGINSSVLSLLCGLTPQL